MKNEEEVGDMEKKNLYLDSDESDDEVTHVVSHHHSKLLNQKNKTEQSPRKI